MKEKLIGVTLGLLSIIIIVSVRMHIKTITPDNAMFLMALSSIMMLSGIVNWPSEVYGKGIGLVCVAIAMSYMNRDIYELLEKTKNVKKIAIQYEMLKDIMLLAYAGAGGSLIGEHAKKNCRDVTSKNTKIDVSDVELKLQSLDSKFNLLIGLLVTLCILVIGLLFFR